VKAMKSKTLKPEQEKWRNNKKKPIKVEQVKSFNSVVEVRLGN
jgi:hypothetical protein